jgi:hypothetical protein
MNLSIEIKDQVIQRSGLTTSDFRSLFERTVVQGLVSVLQMHIDQRELSAPMLGVDDAKVDGQSQLVVRDKIPCSVTP